MSLNIDTPPYRCEIFRTIEVFLPSSKCISDLLRDNGFPGKYGTDFVYRNYGSVIRSVEPASVFEAFIGIHIQAEGLLLHSRWHLIRHRLCKYSMSAGFYQKKDLAENSRFKDLCRTMGTDFDVVGIVGRHDANRSIYHQVIRPPLSYWLACNDQTWIAVDVNYWMATKFNSLTDLLCWRDGEDLEVEDSEHGNTW